MAYKSEKTLNVGSLKPVVVDAMYTKNRIHLSPWTIFSVTLNQCSLPHVSFLFNDEDRRAFPIFLIYKTINFLYRYRLVDSSTL